MHVNAELYYPSVYNLRPSLCVIFKTERRFVVVAVIGLVLVVTFVFFVVVVGFVVVVIVIVISSSLSWSLLSLLSPSS